MGPIGFDCQPVRKESVGAIGDGQSFRKFSCEQGIPCDIVEFRCRPLAGLRTPRGLFCLRFFRDRLLQPQRFSMAFGVSCLYDRQYV